MGPWGKILNYARDINRKVGTTLTTEKAKKIRRGLIVWGAVLVAVGAVGSIIGVVVMFSGFGDISFMAAGANVILASDNFFEGAGSAFSDVISSALSSALGGIAIVSISSFVSTIGAVMIKAGLAILIAGEGAKFLDTAHKCPNCGDPVEDNEAFCNKCGADLRSKTKCSKCGTQNDMNDQFCRNCGNKLF